MPFIRTATLGGPGANVLPANDILNHVNMIRVRATGSGNLIGTLYSLDDVETTNLATLAMASSAITPLQSLANFTTERMSLKPP